LARACALLAAAAAALLLGQQAAAQSVSAAVDDLRDNDVTFEEGAVDDRDLAELDDAAAELQDGDAFFKIVVLGDRVTTAPSVRAFAQEILAGLGGEGRVLVYDPATVGIATDVDSSSEATRAEDAAIEAANESDSFAEGALAAGRVLIGSSVPAEVDGDEGGGGGGGGGGWLIWVLVIGGVGVGALLLLRGMLGGTRPDEQARAALGEGEKKVRAAVDRTANLVLALADRIELPDAPAEAKEAYREGSAAFMDVQDELEQADTRPELEAVYPRLVEAEWRLQTASALLEEEPAPPKPKPEPLFPVPAPRAQPAPPPPEPHYQEHGTSPWLTEAAMTAMSILLSRGFGGGGSGRSYRDPMGDDVFGGLFPGGGGGGGGRRGRPRISLGRGGRGMGRR
jgi:hypothetical protein